jgi:hypothetical protein
MSSFCLCFLNLSAIFSCSNNSIYSAGDLRSPLLALLFDCECPEVQIDWGGGILWPTSFGQWQYMVVRQGQRWSWINVASLTTSNLYSCDSGQQDNSSCVYFFGVILGANGGCDLNCLVWVWGRLMGKRRSTGVSYWICIAWAS